MLTKFLLTKAGSSKEKGVLTTQRQSKRHFLRATLRSITLFVALFSQQPVHAQFNFNFTNFSNDPDGSVNELGQLCGSFGGLHCETDTSGTPDGESTTPTGWVQEVVDIGGAKYWHNIVIDDDDVGSLFKLEYYTKFGIENPDFATAGAFIAELNKSTYIIGDGAGFIPNENLDTGFNRTTRDCFGLMGNACNPLGHNKYIQANGYGNPERSAMRMELTGLASATGETFELIYEKSQITQKPLITQQNVNSDITVEFRADMRAKNFTSYGNTLVAGSDFATDEFVNKVTFTGGGTPSMANFDYATDADIGGDAKLLAGRFTFTRGLGWDASRPNVRFRDVVADFNTWNMGNGRIYDKGVYDYDDGGSFDLDEVRWDYFMDPGQNPCGGDPWCDGTGTIAMPQ